MTQLPLNLADSFFSILTVKRVWPKYIFSLHPLMVLLYFVLNVFILANLVYLLDYPTHKHPLYEIADYDLADELERELQAA